MDDCLRVLWLVVMAVVRIRTLNGSRLFRIVDSDIKLVNYIRICNSTFPNIHAYISTNLRKFEHLLSKMSHKLGNEELHIRT